MADNPLQGVPTEITAGDTVAWSREGGNYPASGGWVLAYTLLSPSAVINFAAQPDDDDYVVNVLASTSAGWGAGTYRVQEYVTSADGTERYTLATYTIQILPNAAAATGGLDMRSQSQIILDNINAYLQTNAPGYASLEINGRKLGAYPLVDLLKLRDRFAMIVAVEQRTLSGRRGGNRILAVL